MREIDADELEAQMKTRNKISESSILNLFTEYFVGYLAFEIIQLKVPQRSI